VKTARKCSTPAVPQTLENLIAADWKKAELNMKTNPRRTRTGQLAREEKS